MHRRKRYTDDYHADTFGVLLSLHLLALLAALLVAWTAAQ